MLCFRCEYRARFLETGERHRHECGDILKSKSSCYMFMPCCPVVTKATPGWRPRFAGALFSTRENAVCVLNPDKGCNVKLDAIDYGKGKVALVWKEG